MHLQRASAMHMHLRLAVRQSAIRDWEGVGELQLRNWHRTRSLHTLLRTCWRPFLHTLTHTDTETQGQPASAAQLRPKSRSALGPPFFFSRFPPHPPTRLLNQAHGCTAAEERGAVGCNDASFSPPPPILSLSCSPLLQMR